MTSEGHSIAGCSAIVVAAGAAAGALHHLGMNAWTCNVKHARRHSTIATLRLTFFIIATALLMSLSGCIPPPDPFDLFLVFPERKACVDRSLHFKHKTDGMVSPRVLQVLYR